MENLENIGLDCPCYDFGDCSTPTFDIGDFMPIGANNGKLTITVNGEVVAEFYANQSEDTTANIDLNGYATSEELEETKADLEAEIDDKASISELEEEANIRVEEDSRLSDEIDQLGEELNTEVNARTQADIALGNRIDLKADITALTAETTNRENADIGLQSQIDAITSQSDVVDIVGTYAELQAYDTSHLGDNDIVKVLTDSTHDNAPSYFRWNKTEQIWSYVGSESVAYTKAEADDRFVPKTRTINNKALSENITLTTNDLTNDSGYLTEADLTDYVKNTDYSTATKAGVVRDANCFLTSDTNGGAYAEEMTYATYANASDYNFVGKGTLENVLNGRKYLMPEFVQELPATGADNKLYLTPAEEQPDVEKNISGKEIEIADASEGDLIDWTIKGDTEQASYTGKNLFAVSLSEGSLTYTKINDNSFYATWNKTTSGNDTRFFTTNNFTLKPNTQYVLSFNVNIEGDSWNNTGKVRLNINNTYTGTWSDNNNKLSFTTDSTGLVKFAFYVYYNAVATGSSTVTWTNVQLEQSTQATSFEPYVGGTASPNPDYPQEVKTVTGRNTVSVVGKNLFNIDNYTKAILRGGGSAVSATKIDEKTLRATNLISQSNNFVAIPIGKAEEYLSKTLTVSFDAKLNGVTSTRVQLYWINNNSIGDSIGTTIYVSSNRSYTQTTQIPSTKPTNATELALVVYANASATPLGVVGSYVDYSNIQIEQGSTATPFQSYSGQEVEINLGKNIADTSVVYWANSTVSSSGVRVNNTNYDCYKVNLSDGTYTFASTNAYTGSGETTIRLVAFDKNDQPIKELFYRSRDTTGRFSDTFTVTNGMAYGVFQVRKTDTGIQLERGDKATEYAPYFEPIELCKLGDYQDRIYKDGNEWKIEKHIEKKVFNGSENWITTERTWRLLNPNMSNMVDVAIDNAAISDHFLYWANKTGSIIASLPDNAFGLPAGKTSIDFRYASMSDVNAWKSWLANNNVTIYYALATPYTATITYQPLIDQLNELETLTTVKDYNAVTTDTPTVQPFLDFTYFRPDPTVTKDEWLWIENHYEQLGGERRYTHNMSVNHNTAQGHWDYAFTIVGKEASHYTQLAQVAYYLFREHAGLTIPVSGTYTEGNNVYLLTKITASSLSQVTIEMRKLSDGTIRTISTGAVPVQDTIS